MSNFLHYRGAVYREVTASVEDILLYEKDSSVPSDEGAAWLRALDRPGLAFRGMEFEEYDATLGSGKPIKSTGKYSLVSEGTCFSQDAATAESYANFGRSDPRKTGKPTYLVAVKQTQDMYRDRDGYIKCPVEVPNEAVVAVYEMDDYYGTGEISVRPFPAGSWDQDLTLV